MNKLRVIVKKRESNVFGLTIPEDIFTFFSGCYFYIEKSGTCIIAYSGSSNIPTKKETEIYEFQDVRV